MTPPPAGTQPFDPRSLYSSSSSSSPNKPAAASSSPSAASNGSAVKREPSATRGDDADSSPGAAGSTAGGKKKPSKRRKVNLACIYCRRSHMTCDEGRPCQRCIKRDIGHLCHDEATPAKANDHSDTAPGASATPSKPKAQTSSAASKPTPPTSAPAPASLPAPATSTASDTAAAAAAAAANNFFPTLGLAGTSAGAVPSGGNNPVFGGGSAGPYSSVSPMSSLNQQEFNTANIFKPQAASSLGGSAMQPSPSSGGVTAAGMLSLASLFQNSINNNNNGSTDSNTAPSNPATSLPPPAPSASATAQSGNANANAGEMAGLGGAGWLGLGGGPGGYEGGGSGFGGDSAGGNEFTLLSEFLESLDGPGFGAGATPGMTGNVGTGTGSGSGFTPSQSRRNTISGLTSGAGMLEGLTALTPINNNDSRASLPALGASNNSMYNPGPSSSSTANMTSFNNNGSSLTNTNESGSGKRSRRSSFSAATSTGNTNNTTNTTSASGQSSGMASGSYLPSLSGGSSKTERFFLTAADQKDGTRDERLARVIQAKYEAGLLRPYNHVNGYARLNRWMERNVSAASKRRILKPLSVFRPAFRAVAQSLTNIDLIFIEEAFERLLLDYDRVFSTQGIPACLWRRTGEIYKGNKEFAELVGVPIESLREGRLCIYELMAEESAVNYWEKYGAVSFDPGQKAVLTSCVLRTKNKAIVAAGGSASGIGGKENTAGGNSKAAMNAINAQLPRSATASGQITPNNSTNEHKDLKEIKEDNPPQPKKTNAAGVVTANTGATISSGVLKDPNNPKAAFIHCCFSFTIRRDQWNIPHMIVGNFLPTNPP